MQIRHAMSSVLVAAMVFALTGCMDPFSYGERSGGAVVPDEITYENDVYPILLSYCSSCHSEGGVASGSALVLSNVAATDYEMISSFVVAEDSDGSLLLQKASGFTTHGGSETIAQTSIEYQILADWVDEGAAQQ